MALLVEWDFEESSVDARVQPADGSAWIGGGCHRVSDAVACRVVGGSSGPSFDGSRGSTDGEFSIALGGGAVAERDGLIANCRTYTSGVAEQRVVFP